MKQETAVMALAKAFREWQKEWDMFDKENTKQLKSFDEFIQPFLEMEKEQTEISDDEIEKEAKRFAKDGDYMTISTYLFDGFIQGAKWYREQLKKK